MRFLKLKNMLLRSALPVAHFSLPAGHSGPGTQHSYGEARYSYRGLQLEKTRCSIPLLSLNLQETALFGIGTTCYNALGI